MEERTNEAFELGEELTVVGSKLRRGDMAPEFELETLDPKSGSIAMVRLSESAGSVRLLSTLNSVDTPVCHVETLRWEESAAQLPDLKVFTISMDLPFAMSRWQTQANVNHVLLSAHKNEAFGTSYGVLIKEWRLLQRAVFVIDPDGKILHAEYVADQMKEPDYAAALEVVRAGRAFPRH